MVIKLLKMQLLEDDDDELEYADDASASSIRKVDGRPTWMKSLQNSAQNWLRLLPESLVTLKRTVENIKDPLYRFFEREVPRRLL